jgi:tetratricopeptide (TPR) repeat protein
MGSSLANKLMSARSARSFLRQQGGALGWEGIAELKSEVDRLVGRDLKMAARLVSRIRELADLLGDPISKAFAQASRARVLHFSGRPLEARQLYERAESALGAAGLLQQAAILQKQRLDVLISAGQYQEALRVARSARRALSRGGPIQIAQLENNLGNIYYQLDQYKKALYHYNRARRLLSSSGDARMRAIVDFNRSNVFIETDKPNQALRLLKESAARFGRARQKLQRAQVHFHIAYIDFLRGNYGAALRGYYEARDRLTKLGAVQLVAWCDLEIAEILLALSAFEESAENAANARESFRRLGLPYESAKSSMVEGLARIGQGQLTRAKAKLSYARRFFESSRNSTLTAVVDLYLAELALRRGQRQEATKIAARALRSLSRRGLRARAAHARLILARASYGRGDLTGAWRQSRAALRSVEGLMAHGVAYQCYHLMGLIERDTGRVRLALESFRRAIQLLERLRGRIAADEFKATFLSDKLKIYEDAIMACLEEGSPRSLAEAFRLVEASKSRALADLLARYVRRGRNSKIRQQLARLLEDLNWYSSNAQLEEEKGDQRRAYLADRYRRAALSRERQIARLFRRLELEDPSPADMGGFRGARLEDLIRALEPDECAIEYFIAGNWISAFMVSRDSMRVVRNLAPLDELEQSLLALRFQLDKFNYGPDYVGAHLSQLKMAADLHLSELYDRVFAPLEEMIKWRRIIIIPHGLLHYVPFHALHDGGSYLVDRFEISYAPSAAVLKLCRARRARSKRDGDLLVALGLAEPDTPHIEDELRWLSQMFPRSTVLSGDAATLENLFRFAPIARFLHLASHGYFRGDNPMFSSLKLADAHLNFYTLFELRLKAELVTLSACHTGMNRIFPGDELQGLARGFLYAGAPSLVVSLWAVNDSSTAQLMRHMYEGILLGQPIRAALRAAQIAIKCSHGHPYYWAPFIVVGDPR